MLFIFLVSLAAVAPANSPSRPIWAVVTKVPAASRARTTVEFGTLGTASRDPHRLAYYARRTTNESAASPRVTWADSVTCPAMVEVVGDLRSVPTPKIDVPGFPGQPGGMDEQIVLDGISYTLTVSDALRFSSNVGSPLAGWTERMLENLETCWSEAPPKDVG